jgi:hypothetical protein
MTQPEIRVEITFVEMPIVFSNDVNFRHRSHRLIVDSSGIMPMKKN